MNVLARRGQARASHPRLRPSFHPAFILFAALAFGCGGSGASGQEEVDAEEATTGAESPRAPEDDGMEIEGTLGTISQRAIEDGLQRNVDRITRCFAQRYGQVEFLGGQFEMAFRIKTDGNVRWVYLRRSTIGDRETERCILNVLARVQFARPAGGEAEFRTPLELDAPDDVREPVAWSPSRVAALVAQRRASLASSCGSAGTAGLHVTAYVAPGGRVLSAGAAADDPDGASALDCVAENVRGWTMPDPGSYPAKVTFDL